MFKRSVLVITPSSWLSCSTGRILSLLLIIRSCISFKVVSGPTCLNSTFMYSVTGLISRPRKIALSTSCLEIYPLRVLFSSITINVLILYLVRVSPASLMEASGNMWMTGEVIMSLANLSKLIRFRRNLLRSSSAWTRVLSRIVAEAACGCPPPPKSMAISPTFTSGSLLLATR